MAHATPSPPPAIQRTPTASQVVETSHGRVQGEIFRGISIFRGIPYAASTSGAHRFRAPRPVEPWTGIRSCASYGETAPQAPGPLAEGGWKGHRPEMGEDCLCLNVWTPSADSGRRPVMVWLHGGGFEAGSGSNLLYEGTNLSRRGNVVIVTINHRLGIFGHCALEDLAGEAFAGSANAGYLDIVAALRFVATNVGQFGGDSNNITVFGQSGGGRKVSLLTASPLAQGLLHRAIVQSGSHLRILSRESSHELAERLLAYFDLQPSDVKKLQGFPWRDIRRANRDITRATRLRYSPAIDGSVFHAHPWDIAAPATAATIPMIIGTCRTELSNQLGSADPGTFELDHSSLSTRLARFVPAKDVPELIAIFERESPGASASEIFFKITTARGYWRDSILQTEAKARQASAPVYAYRLMWRTPVEGGRRITPHSLDLPFVFDNVSKAPQMVGPETSETRTLAQMMSESWLAFARTGDPNNSSIPSWAPYDLDRRPVMLFDSQATVPSDPQHEERLAMERYPTQQMGRILHP